MERDNGGKEFRWTGWQRAWDGRVTNDLQKEEKEGVEREKRGRWRDSESEGKRKEDEGDDKEDWVGMVNSDV